MRVNAAPRSTRVLVAGGGVAALETVLALSDLAGDRVSTTLLTSAVDYVLRPMAVRAPFGSLDSERVAISGILGDRAGHVVDDLASVDPRARTVQTASGRTLAYDALVIACGAVPTVRYPNAVTIDDRGLGALLSGTLQEIDRGELCQLAFVAPERMGWPLPLYELALLTAHHAAVVGSRLETAIVTPEDRPLEVFGATASRGVSGLLRTRNIELFTSVSADVPHPRQIVMNPGERKLSADRVIALPELFGPAIAGLPQDAFGFVPTDPHGRVAGIDGVYAAGDATDFPIKHGGLSAQMAVAAARSIAVQAGARATPEPVDLVLRGLLLTGEHPRELHARHVGGHAFESRFGETSLWDPRSKVSTRYLGRRLARLGSASRLAS